jgi:hypothetical protein
MFIPIILSVRGVFVTSLILIGLGISVIINSSKEKAEYEKRTGTIEYFDKTYLNYPHRSLGDYRYIKINSYNYVFEIYVPNGEQEVEPIDNLTVGDQIDTYFYETGNTHSERINRFLQFIDKENKPYFKRGNFQKQLGYAFIGMVVLINVFTFFFWKRGKFAW